MWLRATCNLEFRLDDPTPLILMLRPRSDGRQWVARETYLLSHGVRGEEYTDIFGNLCQRVVAPRGEFTVRTSSDVMTGDSVDRAPGAAFVAIQDLPPAVLMYLLPSRYCESDRFGNLATTLVDGMLPGYDQVCGIANWIQSTIRYAPGSSVYPLSAVEVNERQQGVCRDLAHLGIALCRSISIPARLVVGFLYGLEPMDLHAWFEVYVGGRWYAFDPTRNTSGGGRVAVAYGRDAADVAIYHQFGPPALFTDMNVRVDMLSDPNAE